MNFRSSYYSLLLIFLNISNLDPTRTQSHEKVTTDTGNQEIITKTSS